MAIKMEHKPMTRGDEIRAMDDKALARFIMQIEELEGPKYCQCRPECDAALEELNGIDNDRCAQCLEQWLGQEVCTAEPSGLGKCLYPLEDDPFTLDQIRKMRGQWVWIVCPDENLTVRGWAYIGSTHVFSYWEYSEDQLVGRVAYPLDDYGAWLAYAHPLGGEPNG